MTNGLANDLSQRLKSDAFLSFATKRTGVAVTKIAQIIDHYTAEVSAGENTLAGIDFSGKRVLEVGAGIGLLSIALSRAGVAITALEPGANGFDANAVLGAAVRAWLEAEKLFVLDIEVAELDRHIHGEFDVIFSINVLEHIPDLEGAICAMERVLAPGGRMVHLCPNYAIPYEPHFGIPLLPLAPRLTARLFPAITKHPVWPSLNFVTFHQVRRFARKAGLVLMFKPAMMHKAFVRLDQDAVFSARHTGMVARMHRILKSTGMLNLLRYVPACLATPMAFEGRRVSEASAGAPSSSDLSHVLRGSENAGHPHQR